MARSLIWISDQRVTGWACTHCGWNYELPSLLRDPEAKSAYDRLASGKFAKHDCAAHGPVTSPGDKDDLAERARKLVLRGFKPKDAVEIALQEIAFETRHDPKIIAKVQKDADEFLRRVKDGLI
jgi:hypothetical protein